MQFHGDRYANPAGLVTFLQDQKGAARVRDNRIVLRRDSESEQARLPGAFAIARDLASLAAPVTARATA